ncbi:MAG: nuclear transport factor 2 family protein [Acidimicrobiia bacterium]|jgi:limonene-1,2-epoxide hydrolase|nr:nuclear transport factor 2 family protein [Acidimicrobiia bacterium]MBP8181269.1 nuclear transport factor 2 family protein [Acidimicrobiia bacterium]
MTSENLPTDGASAELRSAATATAGVRAADAAQVFENLTPSEVVTTFLYALAADDLVTVNSLLADDVEWINVGLPTVRGKRVRSALAGLERRGIKFEVVFHAISADGSTVLTERTDAIIWGRFRSQFWVWGRFEVLDGKITLWRDSFDVWDMVKAGARAVAGAVVPSLRPTMPSAQDAPGRG